MPDGSRISSMSRMSLPALGRRRSRLAPDDSSLRARFHAGDEAALDEVYRRHHGQLLAIAIRRTTDRDVAAEAVQQAFVQAWRAAGAYDPTRALAPWLCAIMLRVCVDLLRRDRRAPGLFRDGRVPDHVSVPAAGELVEREWEARVVRRAVDALPAGEREVVRLTDLDDLSFAEAADCLDVPIGTVKSRSFRGRRRLAAVLATSA